MSNNQNIAVELLGVWQEQMEKYLKDPHTANKMMEFYAGFQKFAESGNAKKSEFDSSKSNNPDNDVITNELVKRIEYLESKVAILEAAFSGVIKGINSAK